MSEWYSSYYSPMKRLKHWELRFKNKPNQAMTHEERKEDFQNKTNKFLHYWDKLSSKNNVAFK